MLALILVAPVISRLAGVATAPLNVTPVLPDNVNPNAPPSVPPNVMLPVLLVSALAAVVSVTLSL